MSVAGWMPVDEATGWTPVAEPAKKQPASLEQQTLQTAARAGETQRATMPILPTPEPSGAASRFISGLAAGAKQMNPVSATPPDWTRIALGGLGPVPNILRGIINSYESARAMGQGVIPSLGAGGAAGMGLDAPGIRERAQRGDIAGIVGEGVPMIATTLLAKPATEALGEAINRPSPAEIKSNVADAVYKRGLGVSEQFSQASDAIHDEVGRLADNVADKVNAKFPQGAIDPSSFMTNVENVKQQILKTPERYPAGLADLLSPETTRSTGPRVMGQFMDLSDPSQMAAYQKLKASGAFTDAEIQRMEGSVPGANWDFETAKQWRSKLGQAIPKVQGPMKSVLESAYKDLSTQMRRVAEDSGALSEYTSYNQLHQKHMRFLEDPTVKRIMGGITSDKTLKPLSDPEDMAHLDNLLSGWKKYGIDTGQLREEGADYSKAQAIMEKSRFRWWPWGTLGGMAGGHLLGIGYPAGAVLGLTAEHLLSPAGRAAELVEASKVSPFYDLGAEKAAAIARGYELPKIAAAKVNIKP